MQRRERIGALIAAAIAELNLQHGPGEQLAGGPETPLFAADGPIDSLGLVNLIADLEGRLEAEFGTWINLADEDLLASSESPFRNAGALAAYIDGVL